MIKIVTSSSELEKLQSKWEELARGSDSYCIYNQPKLLKLWWDHFGADGTDRPFILKRGFEIAGEASVIKSLFVVVCYENDDVIGILPLMKVSARPKGEKHFKNYLMFVGDYIFVPTPSITVKKGKEKKVFEEISKHFGIEKSWDVLYLAPIFEKSVNRKFFNELSDYKLSAPIEEILFTRHWDKNKVLKKIERLIEIDNDMKRKKLLKIFLEEVNSLDEVSFSSKCFPILTARLVALLNMFDGNLSSARGLIFALKCDISPVTPFVNQEIVLPKDSQTFLNTISGSIKRKYNIYINKQNNEIGFNFHEKLNDVEYEKFLNLHADNFKHSLHFSRFTFVYYKALFKELEKYENILWLIGRTKQATPIFFLLLYKYGDILSAIVPARDKNFDQHDVGTLGYIISAIKGIELGCEKFDFRFGNEKYKADFKANKKELMATFVSFRKMDYSKLIPKQWLIKY